MGELAEISVEASSLLFEIPAKKKSLTVIEYKSLSAGADEFTKKSYQRNVPIKSKSNENFPLLAKKIRVADPTGH